MNHSTQVDQTHIHGYVPFQLELDNGLLHSANNNHKSKSVEITRDVNTDIIYIPLPEQRLQLVQHQQLIDVKHQIERDFSISFRHMNQNELSEIFLNTNEYDTHRYISSYQHLYQCLLQSKLRIVDINDNVSQIKHSIIYESELLPILVQNHKLAKRERKILYNIVTQTWRKFDERIQNEINLQHQQEQLKTEHQIFTNLKIKQEQYQTFYNRLEDMNIDVIKLKREIQQLIQHKNQLENEMQEIKTHCSHSLVQLNFLKSNVLRTYTNELNNLQLERDSLITQTELIKYNLFQQIHQYDNTLKDYHKILNSFRLVLIDLEQQIKQQADKELIHLQQSNFIEHKAIHDDTQKLILILENKIEEKKLANIQLQKNIDDYEKNIFKQKQLLTKREHDYKTMDHMDEQLKHNINIYRDTYLQLKTARRTIHRRLRLKLKEYSNDSRLYGTLNQQYEVLLNQRKTEQMRTNTLNEHMYPLIDETIQLKNRFENLHHENTHINPNVLLTIQEKVSRLKNVYETYVQHKLTYTYTKNNYLKTNEKLHIKTNRIVDRMKNMLNKIEQNKLNFANNYENIQSLETKITEEQHQYLHSKYFLTEMKNHSESHRSKQKLIKMQIQVTSNNIKHSQYRLKSFTEQLLICYNGLVEQQTSLDKLRQFYFVLKEQDEIYQRKLSHIYNQNINYQNKYECSQKHLQQTKDNLKKYVQVRSILGRMVVRRINLCQLLYKKLARYDEYIDHREKRIEIISKCVHSLKIQIRHNREQNRKLIERKDKYQLEVVKIHIDKMLDRSHEKQRLLRKQIFQRHFNQKYTLKPLPCEEPNYLKNKFYLIKNRFIKIICRGIICNLVLIAIQKEFSSQLENYLSKSDRKTYINLNVIRSNLYQLMRQLKAKTAENNMLIDYQYYFQLMHTDTIQQLLQWTSKNERL